jgi:hypothetical protein
MSWSDEELRQHIDGIGVEELGRRYAYRTIERLNAAYAAEGDPIAFADDEDDWIDATAFDGEELTDEEYFRTILAALEAARGHAGALWCIADGPMSHLVGRDRSYAFRFHTLRSGNESMAGAFDAMQKDLDALGLTHGFWADDFLDRGFT